MNAGEITALATGIPAILAAITALITAIRAHATAKAAVSVGIKAHNMQFPASDEKVVQGTVEPPESL